MRISTRVVLVSLVALAACTPVSGQSRIESTPAINTPTSAPAAPIDLDAGSPDWPFADEEATPAGSLLLLSKPGDRREHLFGLDAPAVDITIDFDAYASTLPGKPGDFAGVLCRYVDPDNFYALGFYTEGDRAGLAVLRMQEGELKVLDHFAYSNRRDDLPLWVDTWLAGEERVYVGRLRVECTPDRLRMWLHDRLVLQFFDRADDEGDAGLALWAGGERNATTPLTWAPMNIWVQEPAAEAPDPTVIAEDFSDPPAARFCRRPSTMLRPGESGLSNLCGGGALTFTYQNPDFSAASGFVADYLPLYLRDVRIEAELTFAEVNDLAVGLACRGEYGRQAYLFMVTPTHYNIVRFDHANPERDYFSLSSPPWGWTPLPTPEPQTTQRVRAECQGEDLRLYVNERLVAALRDDTWHGGLTGLALHWADNEVNLALVDNFTVTALEPDGADSGDLAIEDR
jgi:hypothetical protein